MQNISDALSTFSAWAISITAILAALAAIFKPMRKLMAFVWNKMSGGSSSEKVIAEIKATKTDLSNRIDGVSLKCDTNERDRLQQIVFNFGNFARKKQVISGEEFRYLQKCFKKYSELQGNDLAHDEYMFIVDYFNKQGWNV